MSPTDEELMSEVAKGQTSRLAELYGRYKTPVFGFLMNRAGGDRATSEDLLQNTFERILRYRSSWREGQSFRAWIFAIARNAYQDHLRREGRLTLEEVDVPTETSQEEPEPIFDCRRALAALPDPYRVVVELAWQRNLKYAEIATVLGTTEANVKVRMHRACKQLRANYHNANRL
ncbi:RNA polymerase sigma factor [Neolewinella litorea]|uniref:RNA polymerase sigma factor n=1 Tax=Neolewinella litorea TaxID=2562452 RepID=A0A4S4NK96_9BACT|nr:RNA polymerase sigma factor [Neolewinella litorea]THH39365.1 RNA polymerase sigma factor [Neolewinella litorea]